MILLIALYQPHDMLAVVSAFHSAYSWFSMHDKARDSGVSPLASDASAVLVVPSPPTARGTTSAAVL